MSAVGPPFAESPHLSIAGSLALDFSALDLRAKLLVIRTLGEIRLQADSGPPLSSAVAVIEAASRVFSAWPSTFFDLARDLNTQRALGRCARRLYRLAYRTQNIWPERSANMLSVAIEALLSDPNPAFRTARATLLDSVPKRHFSAQYPCTAQVAKLMRVQPTTVKRFLTQSSLVVAVTSGKSKRLLLEASTTALAPREGAVLRIRQAAATLDLSVDVLRELKKQGVFRVRSVLPSKPGFHEGDLVAFEAELCAHAKQIELQEGDMRNVGSLLRSPHYPTQTKVALCQEMISGRLGAYVTGERDVAHLFVRQSSLAAFLQAARADDVDLSVREVAKQIGCAPECVPLLVRYGRIKAASRGIQLRISQPSLLDFQRDWLSLAALAREARTSSRCLQRDCERLGLTAFALRPRGHTQTFVLRSQAECLRDLHLPAHMAASL